MWLQGVRSDWAASKGQRGPGERAGPWRVWTCDTLRKCHDPNFSFGDTEKDPRVVLLWKWWSECSVPGPGGWLYCGPAARGRPCSRVQRGLGAEVMGMRSRWASSQPAAPLSVCGSSQLAVVSTDDRLWALRAESAQHPAPVFPFHPLLWVSAAHSEEDVGCHTGPKPSCGSARALGGRGRKGLLPSLGMCWAGFPLGCLCLWGFLRAPKTTHPWPAGIWGEDARCILNSLKSLSL